jgi:hypothetical protein
MAEFASAFFPNQRALPHQLLALNGLIIVPFIFALIGTPTGQPEHRDQADQHQREE